MYFLNQKSLYQILKTNHQFIKSISTSIINFESNLSLLRKKTGLTFILCKKALEENNNNLKLAEEWLKEEVKRTGLEKSQKMSYRVANEGLVGVYIDKFKKNGVVLEVNCETDFVSKNIKFKELVSKLTKEFANVSQVEENPIKNTIQKYVLSQDRIPKENEHISEAITHLGEKIQIKKACFIKNHYEDSSISLVGYAHSTEGLNNYLDDVTFGKYGTIVALKQLPQSVCVDEKITNDNLNENNLNDDENELLDFNTAAKQICQHIIVAAPEKIRPDELDNEKTKSDENESKTNLKTNDNDESSNKLSLREVALIEQEFLHADYEKVDDFLKANNLEVIDFIRIKCGEE